MLKTESILFKLIINKYTQWCARLLFGGVFIISSLDKIANPERFEQIIGNYNILPTLFIKPVSIILPWIELICGIFLISGIFIFESAMILVLLLITFILMFITQVKGGSVEDCGCFSESSPFSFSSIPLLLLRDGIFLTFGIILVIPRFIKSTCSEILFNKKG